MNMSANVNARSTRTRDFDLALFPFKNDQKSIVLSTRESVIKLNDEFVKSKFAKKEFHQKQKDNRLQTH